jgi:3-deoxy-D-manno-octulosonic-acid transferase
VNGRIGERSASRFRRAGRLVEPIVSALSLVCAQLPAYAERFRALGVPAERIAITGNLKLDNVPVVVDRARAEAYARVLALDGTTPLLVAGSTHAPEERAVGRILARLRAEGRAVRAVVAPRHPPRADAAEADLRRAGLEVVRRSALSRERPASPDAVVLLDTVGELETVYALADVVFVGGSLVRHGGQNIMEPASLAKPVVIGPHAFNFRGEVDLLLAAGGLVEAADEADVLGTIRSWLVDPAAGKTVGERGRTAILESKGATERTMALLGPFLDAIASRSRAPVTRVPTA